MLKPTRFVNAFYKPVEGGFDKKEDEKQETSRERAARHSQERRTELTFTGSDKQRWARNRERVITERQFAEPQNIVTDGKQRNRTMLPRIINIFKPAKKETTLERKNRRLDRVKSELYTKQNIIGYTKKSTIKPTVYFKNGNYYGHITQEHDLVDNIGREVPIFDDSKNVLFRNQLDGNEVRLYEYYPRVNLQHTSRSKFRKVNDDNRLMLEESLNITEYKKINIIDDFFSANIK